MSSKKVLEEARDNETYYKSVLALKEDERQELLKEMEESKKQTETELLKKEELELQLSLSEQQLSQTVAAEGFGSCDSQNSSCKLSDTSHEDSLEETTEQQQLPLSSVPPTMISPVTLDQGEGMGSIMEEIKEAVVMDRLPSPLCKKELRKSEVELKRIRERLVEITFFGWIALRERSRMVLILSWM